MMPGQESLSSSRGESIRQHSARTQVLVALLLGLAAAVQMWVVWDGYARDWYRNVSRTMELEAWKRSALYLGGEEFAERIEFVRSNSPSDARIVLPPNRPVTLYSNIGFIQYFLFPRDIHNCGANEIEACVRRIQGGNTYILATAEFPPRELASKTRVFLQYDDDFGLFAPPR